MRTVRYKHGAFVTQLPAEHLYTRSHEWLARVSSREWRVGYTKFAFRMLGELVEVKFDLQPGTGVHVGDIVGTIEGFKALSDIHCVAEGRFVTGNASLSVDLDCVARNPYDEGWLYQLEGHPDGRSLDVDGYRALLDVTIDRLLEKQRQEEP